MNPCYTASAGPYYGSYGSAKYLIEFNSNVIYFWTGDIKVAIYATGII